MKRLHAVSTAALLRASSLSVQSRAYLWPYKEDFVPKGAATSRIQSSTLPSQRVRVLTAYALAPLFGASTRICSVGSLLSPAELMGSKGAIHAALCQCLSLQAGKIKLGSIVRLQSSQMHISQDDFSLRRCYATNKLLAVSLIDVILANDEDIQDDLLLTECRKRIHNAIAVGAGGSTSQDPIRANAAISLREAGVTYVEFPKEDLSDENVPEHVGGVEVTEEAVEEALDRWGQAVR